MNIRGFIIQALIEFQQKSEECQEKHDHKSSSEKVYGV
jgi:hypothetical protein